MIKLKKRIQWYIITFSTRLTIYWLDHRIFIELARVLKRAYAQDRFLLNDTPSCGVRKYLSNYDKPQSVLITWIVVIIIIDWNKLIDTFSPYYCGKRPLRYIFFLLMSGSASTTKPLKRTFSRVSDFLIWYCWKYN